MSKQVGVSGLAQFLKTEGLKRDQEVSVARAQARILLAFVTLALCSGGLALFFISKSWNGRAIVGYIAIGIIYGWCFSVITRSYREMLSDYSLSLRDLFPLMLANMTTDQIVMFVKRILRCLMGLLALVATFLAGRYINWANWAVIEAVRLITLSAIALVIVTIVSSKIWRTAEDQNNPGD